MLYSEIDRIKSLEISFYIVLPKVQKLEQLKCAQKNNEIKILLQKRICNVVEIVK